MSKLRLGGVIFGPVCSIVACLPRHGFATGVPRPNVVKMYEVIDDPESGKVYLIMEFCAGGRIFDFEGDQVCVACAGCGRPLGWCVMVVVSSAVAGIGCEWGGVSSRPGSFCEQNEKAHSKEVTSSHHILRKVKFLGANQVLQKS